MYIDGRKEAQVQPYGTQTVGGVNEEHQSYEGGIIYALESFNSTTYKDLAEKLNDNFENFGIDLNKYGLDNNNSLRTWKYNDNSDSDNNNNNNLRARVNNQGVVSFTDEYAKITYVQPEEEKIEAKALIMQDGVWYGRDSSDIVTVKITVENNEIVKEEILTGDKEKDQENYQRALSRATSKAIYGDKT
eukprot:jgi/Orpsp1_1/1182077/evm.model.c7180000079777.1